MALPMLVGGGAECGPSNPLQDLSKRFDQDRGIQQVYSSVLFRVETHISNQDHFGAGRVGSTREVS